jgi:hypothetical protein
MRRRNPADAPRNHTRNSAEVYCRRDNRVYAVCPYVQAGSFCPCLHDVETADALFEPTSSDVGPETTRG